MILGIFSLHPPVPDHRILSQKWTLCFRKRECHHFLFCKHSIVMMGLRENIWVRMSVMIIAPFHVFTEVATETCLLHWKLDSSQEGHFVVFLYNSFIPLWKTDMWALHVSRIWSMMPFLSYENTKVYTIISRPQSSPQTPSPPHPMSPAGSANCCLEARFINPCIFQALVF